MIRLHDAASGKLTDLEPRTGRPITLRVPHILAPEHTIAINAVPIHVAADLLTRLLELRSIRVERVAESSEQVVDVAFWAGAPRCGDAPAASIARIHLSVAENLYDGQLGGRRDADGDSLIRGDRQPGATEAGLRYLALTAQYARPWNVTAPGLAAAECALETLRSQLRRLADSAQPADALSPIAQALAARFHAALADNLDTPSALVVLWEAVHADLPPAERLALVLDFDRLLGFDLVAVIAPLEDQLPEAAAPLIEARDAARRDREWSRSDELRAELLALGVEAQDSREGSTYRRVTPAP